MVITLQIEVNMNFICKSRAVNETINCSVNRSLHCIFITFIIEQCSNLISGHLIMRQLLLQSTAKATIIGTSQFCDRMKKIFVLLSLCVLTETLSKDNIVQRNKELILKSKLKPANNNFFGILLVPCMLYKCIRNSSFDCNVLIRYHLLFRCYWYMATFSAIYAEQC